MMIIHTVSLKMMIYFPCLAYFEENFSDITFSCVFEIKVPIMCGREPTATEEEKNLGIERSTELSSKVNQVISGLSEMTTITLPLFRIYSPY